jgi:hypothetical protein
MSAIARTPLASNGCGVTTVPSSSLTTAVFQHGDPQSPRQGQASGTYKLRVTGYGYQIEEPVVFALITGSFNFRNADNVTHSFHELPVGQSSTWRSPASRCEQRHLDQSAGAERSGRAFPHQRRSGQISR